MKKFIFKVLTPEQIEEVLHKVDNMTTPEQIWRLAQLASYDQWYDIARKFIKDEYLEENEIEQ